MLFKNTAHPDIGGKLIFRDPDLATFQILRSIDPPVCADVDGGLPEGAAEENRNCNIVCISARN